MHGLQASVELEPIECPKCAELFAVTRTYFDARVADQAFFWCPNACNIHLGVPSSKDRLLTATLAELRRAENEIVSIGVRNVALKLELTAARAALVDAAVGTATAEEC